MKYTLAPKKRQPRYASYRLDDLRRMTLLQLRDICEIEGIIDAALDRLDREELVQLIMKYRGSRERLLLRGYDPWRLERLRDELGRARLTALPREGLRAPSKISVFEGLDTDFFDGYRLTYLKELDGVNALVLDRDGEIRAVLRAVSFTGHDGLFLTRRSEFPCREAEVRDYRLLLFPQKISDELTRVYEGGPRGLPGEIQAYVVPMLAFEVCAPEEADMPLAIDFGTSNTAAGVFLSGPAFERISRHIQPGQLIPDSVNYLRFLTPEGESMPVLPTIIGVGRIDGGDIAYRCGFDAETMAEHGQLGQGASVFYDIKRWASDFEAQ